MYTVGLRIVGLAALLAALLAAGHAAPLTAQAEPAGLVVTATPAAMTTPGTVDAAFRATFEPQDNRLASDSGCRRSGTGNDCGPARELTPSFADYPRQEALLGGVHAAKASDIERAAWAIGRFAEFGLELPSDLAIWFHPDDGKNPGCGGNLGTYGNPHGNPTVNVCTTSEFTLLHELGHAWAALNLDASDREAFVSLRSGATSWADSSDPWVQRGTEHVGNILAWGLMDKALQLSTKPADTASLTEAFIFLTGSTPQHG